MGSAGSGVKNKRLGDRGHCHDGFFSLSSQLGDKLYSNLRRDFPKFFKDSGERKIRTYREHLLETERHWMQFVTMLAAEMSYTEVMAMEIRDFFIFVHVYNQRMEERLKESEKLKRKSTRNGRVHA